jgi:probable phosphoglycerate mutase
MKLPFDGCRRHRIYLVRHGQAAAARSDDGVYGDEIGLTARGIEEARAMRDLLQAVRFDESYSSDLRRARDTAAIILESRDMQATASVEYTEIRGDIHAGLAATDVPPRRKLATFAYLLWGARSPDASFFGGDVFADYLAAASGALERLVRTSRAERILIVSHSGFQRAALSWALDAPAVGMAAFEQDSCCLNILDIDVDEAGKIVRKHVRLANLTPLDVVKESAFLTDGETLAVRLHALVDPRGDCA